MKLFVSFVVGLILGTNVVFAQELSANSKKIERAVMTLESIMRGGIETFETRAGYALKTAVYELAKTSYEDLTWKEFNDSWINSASRLWEVDSNTWGPTNFADARQFVTTPFDEYVSHLNDLDSSKAKSKAYLADVKASGAIFDVLKGTGVQFAVGPLGIQYCGVSPQALFIYDKESGLIYILKKETRLGDC